MQSLGSTFHSFDTLWFGALKFFPGISPAQDRLFDSWRIDRDCFRTMISLADLWARLDACVGSEAPGLQYVAVGPEGVTAEYPRAGRASVALANSTGFRVARFLDEVDAIFLTKSTR